MGRQGDHGLATRAVAPGKSAWTADRKAAFIAALEETGSANKAAKRVGLKDSSGVYYVRKADPDFAAAWDAVVARRGADAPKRGRQTEPPGSDRAPREIASDQDKAGRAAAAAAGGEERAGAAPPAGGEDGPRPLADAPPQPRRRRSDADISAEALSRAEERARIEALRPPMSVDEAKLILQRKGRTVYRASVTGGSKAHWVVSGFAEPIDDEMLKAEAKRIEGRSAK